MGSSVCAVTLVWVLHMKWYRHWQVFCVCIVVFLQLYCPNRISPVGNLGCFHLGKPAMTGSRYPTHGAFWCFSVSLIHRTLTWTTGSLTCTQMSMHMIAHRGVWTPEESQCWKLTLGEKLFAAPGNQTCISGMMVQCGTNWAMSPPQFWHGRTEKQPLPLLCPRVEPLPLGWQSSGLANQPLIPIQL